MTSRNSEIVSRRASASCLNNPQLNPMRGNSHDTKANEDCKKRNISKDIEMRKRRKLLESRWTSYKASEEADIVDLYLSSQSGASIPSSTSLFSGLEDTEFYY